MNLILVGVGGLLGGLSRYHLGNMISRHAKTGFPVGTLLINMSGALLLGILTSIEPDHRLYLLFGDGFCGAFTTFSTFMYEGFHLFEDKKTLNAYIYILGTALSGMILYVCGFAIGKLIGL